MNQYELIDRFEEIEPIEIAEEMSRLHKSILMTRGPWTLAAAMIYREERTKFGTNRCELRQEIFDVLPVSTQPTLTQTITEIEEGRAIYDRSDLGKDKKNRLLRNQTWIQTMKSLHENRGETRSLSEFSNCEQTEAEWT